MGLPGNVQEQLEPTLASTNCPDLDFVRLVGELRRQTIAHRYSIFTDFSKFLTEQSFNVISGFVKHLGKIKEKLKYTRYFTYIFLSVWKVLVFFCSMLLVEYFTVGKIDNLFTMFQPGFGQHKINLTEITTNRFGALDVAGTSARLPEIEQIPAWPNTQIYVLVIQAFASALSFLFGKFACKICIQVITVLETFTLYAPTFVLM